MLGRSKVEGVGLVTYLRIGLPVGGKDGVLVKLASASATASGLLSSLGLGSSLVPG